MTIDLRGKTALVTGAGNGIGAACAKALSQAGALVWVNDKDPEAAQRAAEEIGGRLLPGDVANPEEWLQSTSEVLPLHILIHNAGYDLDTRVGATDIREFELLHRVMLSGPFELTQRLLPALTTANGACVLFIASVHARATTDQKSAYAAAKGGQVAMVNSMAQDLGKFGIRVLAVSPGYIDTRLMEKWINATEEPDATRASAAALHPLGRVGRPEDVAALVTFLASSQAGFINATNVVIDGGISTQLH